MHDAQVSFRQRLLEAERFTPALKAHYDKEIQAMLEKKLSPAQRWSWLAATIVSALSVPMFVALAVLAPSGMPLLARLGLAIGALFAAAWVVVGIRVVRRGSLDLKKDTAIVAALTWCLVVMMATMFLMTMPGTIEGLRMMLLGVVILIGGAAVLLRHVTELESLKTREKLLEVELRLAEMAEMVKTASAPPPDARG